MTERPQEDIRSQVAQERCLRAAVLAGDAEAWRTLYERHQAALYAFIHFRTGGRAHDAEDAAQECWLTAVRRMCAFDPDRGAFAGWLRGIAENVLRNQRRRAGRREAMPATPESAGDCPAGAELAAERAERIAGAMTRLPERYRAVIRAKYEEGLKVAEIATRWGEPAKAVESLLTRAREAFREAYARLSVRT